MSVPSEGNTPYGPGWSHLGTLLTIPEAAAILNVSVPRVYELIRLRLLPPVHLGRQVRVKTGRPGGMVSPRRPTAADRSRLIRPPPQNASRIIQAIALIAFPQGKGVMSVSEKVKKRGKDTYWFRIYIGRDPETGKRK